VPLRMGELKTANMLSVPLALPPLPTVAGRDTRLPPGLAKLPLLTVKVGGSMSREDRNDMESSSSLVLVIVRNESRTFFCSAFEVPFRSRI